MCDVYHVVGIVTTYGLTVALGCLLVHLLAFLLLEVKAYVCYFHLTTACIFLYRDYLYFICNIIFLNFLDFLFF